MKRHLLTWVNDVLGTCSAVLMGDYPTPPPEPKPKYGPPHVL